MMTRQEKRDELAAVRSAFCSSVKWLDAAGRNPEAVERVLVAACAKLRGDLMAMLRDAVNALNQVGIPEPPVRYGASFAEGALIVTALVERWRAAFRQLHRVAPRE